MTLKLNQVVAVEKGAKARTHQHLTQAYKDLQKTPLYAGQTRNYTPLDDEGTRFPAEHQRVQLRADEVIGAATERLTDLFDITATKDWANCEARADVVVDETTLLRGVPATYLLFLEKQLVDIRTFIAHIPTLDASEDWVEDRNEGVHKTRAIETTRTQKVYRNHVKAEATDKHPAQVETYTEDVPVGRWSTVRLSGALPTTRVKEFEERVETLQRAVKAAREAANMTEAAPQKVGEALFAYIFS